MRRLGRSACRFGVLTTSVWRQFPLHNRYKPLRRLLQNQLHVDVLLKHQSLRYDHGSLPRRCTPLRYITLMTREVILGLISAAWATPLLLFSLPSVFTYQDNPAFTMFVEISRVVIFQAFPFVFFVGVTCHLLYLARKQAREVSALVA